MALERLEAALMVLPQNHVTRDRMARPGIDAPNYERQHLPFT